MDAPRTLLLTRPEHQAAEFAAALEAEVPGRFRAIAAPVMAIVPVDVPLDLDGAAALVFTSANGVAQFAARSRRRDLLAYCVGDMTAAAARAEGMSARSADGDVASLAEQILGEPRPAGPLVHIRGRHAAGDLEGRLTAAGVAVRPVEIYHQVPAPIAGAPARLLALGAVDVVALFSPRSARLFARQALEEGWNLAGTVTVALSVAADSELSPLRLAVRRVAARPTREGMIAALRQA